MTEINDEQLMLAFASNDSNSFEILYSRHKDAVYRYFLRHTRNEEISQELHQDLWMKIIKGKSSYQVKAKFTTWLYSLAHNRLVDWYRRNNLEQQSFENKEEETLIDGVTKWNPEDELQSRRLSERLKICISRLPYEQREIFLLHQEAALTIPAIAEMLQEAVEKIKSRYRYAISKLRGCLEILR